MDSILAKVKPHISRCSSLVMNECKDYGMKTIPFTVPTGHAKNKSIPFTVPLSSSIPPSLVRKDSYGDSAPSSGESTPLTPEFRATQSLGAIDPSLYQTNDLDDNYEAPANHLGRLWFEVTYEREAEKLHLTLIKARRLPSRTSTSASACDPFVRIQLLPDDRRCLQTKFKKKTCNPKFDESFMLPMSNKTLEERVLKFTVVDVDRNRRHQIIGHALYPLRDHNYNRDEPVVIWRDLEKEVAETTLEKGEIRLSLCYNDHLERLTTAVFEGRNFNQENTSQDADYYVKIALLQQGRVVKSKKTDISRKTSTPAFNESFMFKLSKTDLETTSLSVTAMQHCTGQRDKQIGRVTVGSFMFARGKELEHWTEMINQFREPVVQWHSLT